MNRTKLNRVPLIVFSYWAIKIASTTLGETGADMFSLTLHLGYAATIMVFSLLFLIFLGVKIFLHRYTASSYWALFTASAILGTGISDYIDRTLGFGYAYGSLILVVLLLMTLIVWYAIEGSIDVEKITTPGAELFYWLAFLIANTLGTAAGDYLADGLGMGFRESAIIIAGLLAVTAWAHYYTKIPSLLLFWVAFVLTRPFGATFGDLLTKPLDHGGLNLGTFGASAFFAILMIMAIVMDAKTNRKQYVRLKPNRF